MLLEERYEKLADMLKTNNYVKVSEIMDLFSVSHETARKYLEELQIRGFAKRVRGGAVSTQENIDCGKSSNLLPPKIQDETLCAAYGASKLVKSGFQIYLDNGTTMANLASFLKSINNLTVVSPNLMVADEIRNCRNIEYYCLSGKYDIDGGGYYGPQSEQSFEFFNFDIAFISCGGVSLKQGTINDFDDKCINRNIIKKHCDKLVLVIGSEKVNKQYFMNMLPIKEIDTIIVDSNIDKEDAEKIRSLGVELIIVPMNQIEKNGTEK